MVRLVQWRLVLAAAMAFAVISSPGVRSQDAGTVTAANPVTTTPGVVPDTTAPAATDTASPLATTAAPIATEAPTTPPVTTQAAATPIVTEAATTITPVATPTATEAPTVAVTTPPVSTDTPTTSTPTAAPSTPEVASSSATMLQDSATPQSSLRNSNTESSASSSSKSASEGTTGTLDGSSSTKLAVICLLGGVGVAIIMSLLFVVWRSRRRDGPDLNTPTEPDMATITFPVMPSVIAPTGQDLSVWKAGGTSFASRDLPLKESIRAKLNATTRSSSELEITNRLSQVASLPGNGTSMHMPYVNRETNASSEQSFSIRGDSQFSLHHAGDSETSAMTNERYSTNDGYSTSDRYSTNGRYSTSSRLSSEVGRSNSGRFQRQVPKNLDMHRFSSTSSTASSVVARKHNPASFINHDLTQTPTTGAAVTTDSTTSRTDVPDWYSVIESPSDNDRYTTSSLDSDNISSERESFEL